MLRALLQRTAAAAASAAAASTPAAATSTSSTLTCITVSLQQLQLQHAHSSRQHSHAFASTSGVHDGDDPDPHQQATEAAGNMTKPQPQLVEQLLSPANMNRRQQLLQRKPDIIQEFQRAPGDTGSPEVQVALLTERIRDMTAHILAHRKDHVSKRGLQGMLNQRRKLLSYLRRDNFARYAFVIHKLGLKDTYAKQERYDKYRVGTRLGTPAEPLKRYGSH